jgi:hypothetical protein
MSQRNGDKSRHHRERKQNIQRRARNRELFLTSVPAAAPGAPGKKADSASSTRSASARPA